MPEDQGLMLDAINQMLADGGGATVANPLAPPGAMGEMATGLPNSEGTDSQVVATLASENAKLRTLLGLGPDDPIPDPDPDEGPVTGEAGTPPA